MKNVKLQKIDESLISEHSCLKPEDPCFFLGEYASRQGYQHSPMNQLIFNLKKSVDKIGQPDWRYKESAISEIVRLFTSTPSWQQLKLYTWIPVPPSAIKNEPEYDDRLLKILAKMNASNNNSLDIREILVQKNSRGPNHLTGNRRTIKDHLSNWIIDENLIQPAPKKILVFDDVITSGASFKAAQALLSEKFGSIPIIGLFIARATNYL